MIALGWSTTANAQTTGLATQYGHKGDKWAGSKFACYFKDGKVQRRYTKGASIKKMDSKVFGVAHRYWPCGTMVKVCRMRKTGGKRPCIVAPVVDRGPYWVVPASCMPGKIASHSCWKRGRSSKGRTIKEAARRGYIPSENWKFANIVDLLPPVSQAINLNGKEAVTIQRCRRRCQEQLVGQLLKNLHEVSWVNLNPSK